MLEVNPDLDDFSYAPESYDAAILIALAAIAAGDDSGESISANLVAVSKEGTKCTTFEECAGLLEDGEDIDYDGVSGPVEFSDAGDPTAGHGRHLPVRPGQHVHQPEYFEGQLEE